MQAPSTVLLASGASQRETQKFSMASPEFPESSMASAEFRPRNVPGISRNFAHVRPDRQSQPALSLRTRPMNMPMPPMSIGPHQMRYVPPDWLAAA